MSAVSVAEITVGMWSTEHRQVWRLLGSLHAVAINEVVARRAGELVRLYRASHAAIGIGDYLIAASAEVRGLTLATLNVRHFSKSRWVRVAPPTPGRTAARWFRSARRYLRSDFDRFVEAVRSRQAAEADLLLGLRERAVSARDLAVVHRHGRRVARRAQMTRSLWQSLGRFAARASRPAFPSSG